MRKKNSYPKATPLLRKAIAQFQSVPHLAEHCGVGVNTIYKLARNETTMSWRTAELFGEKLPDIGDKFGFFIEQQEAGKKRLKARARAEAKAKRANG